MKAGTVYLVGAGPSDVGLLTERGRQLIESADVIVYDRLIGTSLLLQLPDSAELIDVGKRAGNHTLPQADINRLLLTDPDYFFNMAPFALSLGVIHPFARSFGSRKFDQCPYLVTRVHGKRTAAEWAELLADTADLMDERFRRMEIQRLTRGRR